MATYSGMRIGDADRDRAAVTLSEHYAQGRLTLEEFQQRLDGVFAARTAAELASVTRDLPFAMTGIPPAQSARSSGGSPGAGAGSSSAGQTGASARRRAPWPVSWLHVALLLVTAALLIGLFRPAGFGFLPRPLLLLVALLAFVIRMVRRGSRAGRPTRRRRRF
jgi:uncharacterized protein DUF1707